MMDLLVLSLALWVVTHTIAVEIPVTAKAPKPFSCQLCLSGWPMLGAGAGHWINTGDAMQMGNALAIWALSVLIEALYQRLHVTFL